MNKNNYTEGMYCKTNGHIYSSIDACFEIMGYLLVQRDHISNSNYIAINFNEMADRWIENRTLLFYCQSRPMKLCSVILSSAMPGNAKSVHFPILKIE